MIYRGSMIGMNSCAQAINDKPKTLREQIAQKIEDSNAYSAQNEFLRRIDKLENDTRISVEALIEEGNASLSVEVNREIADKIEQLEFNLQRLWGFGESKMHHRYWSRLQMCLCNADSMDNTDDFGLGVLVGIYSFVLSF